MKLNIESEHGFDFFIEIETHGESAKVRLHKDDPTCWRLSCYDDERLDTWVSAGRTGYPEALRRALNFLELELSNIATQKRRGRSELEG